MSAGEEARDSKPVASVSGLAEVVLNVHDMESSLSFYRDLLGLSVISPPEMSNPVFLKAGDAGGGLPAMVVLVALPDGAVAFASPRTLHHLALAISAESFDDTRRRLEDLGIEVRGGKHPVLASRTMYLNDPDGNEVELIAPA
jgi:catechol-2,3-dioxygenase